MYNFLKSKYENQKKLDDWVNFEIIEKEAQENLWELLYDYCLYYGHSYLSNTRDESSKITDDMIGISSFSYPMGKVFSLNHLMKPRKWYWKYT